MTYDGYTKYDRTVAQSYDQDRQGEAHWRAEFDWLAAYSKRRSMGRTLDLPVGTGRLLAAMTSASSIVGVDVSDEMLQVARRAVDDAAIPNVKLQKGDALRLPFEGAAFDSVVCFRLAHLLPPDLIPALLSELSRVSAGAVLLQVYVSAAARPRQRQIAWIAGWVRRLLPRSQKPWSHIESFAHTWAVFEESIAGAGLTILARHRLDGYAGASVEVVELVR